MENRIIKFRVFDKVENRMYHHYDFPDRYVLTLDMTIFDMEAKDEIFFGLGAPVHDRFIVQQFSGLTDKLGEEIYEGDIIKDPCGNLLVVKWNQDTCEYILDYKDGLQAMCKNDESWMEKVGNIFEHRHLIENK